MCSGRTCRGVSGAVAVLVVGVLAGIAAIAVVRLRPHGATDATPARS